jgi:hypothetical protein
MRIVQVIIGKIPEYLTSCVNSVVNFSKINNFDYIRLDGSEFIEQFSDYKKIFFWRRHVSDWIRTKELSINKHTLYVDWDVFLYPDFKIKDKNKACFGRRDSIDCIFYNGNELNIFKNIHEKIEQPSCAKNYNLSRLIREYCDENANYQIFEGHYVHIDNCRFIDSVFVEH